MKGNNHIMNENNNVRNYYYVKVTYSNGRVIRYRELPMDIYEQGVKDHYIKDIQPLNAVETFIIDLVGRFRK